MNIDQEVDGIRVISVIGSGAMGNQIAEIMSRCGGYKVNMMNISVELVGKELASINNRLEKFFVAKGEMTADEKQSVLGRIKGVAKIEEAVKHADLVIESAVENLG